MSFDYDVHVCLVSGQAAPNLLPVLDEQFAPKSGRIFMLVTPDMRKNAAGLAEVFKKHGLRTEMVSIKNPYDLDLIQEELITFFAKAENKKAVLNATGGTKIMALAAHSVFSMEKRPTLYVREDTNSLIIMPNSDTGEKTHSADLNSKLTLADYLRAYGFTTENSPQKDIHKHAFSQEMIANIDKYQDGLRLLNRKARDNNGNPVLSFVEDSTDIIKRMRELLTLCENYQFIEFNNNKVKFADEDAHTYICGGWLEFHTHFIINSLLRKHIQTKAEQNLVIKEGESTMNELDIVFLARNTLHLVECKTAKLDRENDSAVLYKLKTIMQFTGLKTKSMLVTYRELGVPHKKRAKKYRIKVVEGSALCHLKDSLEKWITE